MAETDLKINSEALIKAYNNGESMNSIARRFGTYPITVRRILEKNHIELRHDVARKGTLVVRDGEKLIEWAKAQGRLVTKAELAEVLGKTRLSHSYFVKYPELGEYVIGREQKAIQEYTLKLYNWLKENNISYKPNDRKKLKGVSVTALLLGEYSNIALQIRERPTCVSSKRHEEKMELKFRRSKAVGVTLIFLDKKDFENLDSIKSILDKMKK